MADTTYPGPPFTLYGVKCVSWLTGAGTFRARREEGGEDGEKETVVEGFTLEEVKEKLGKIILARRAKLDIRFSALDTNRSTVRNGTVTGLHAANGNKLVTWEDGRKEQLSGSFYSLVFFPRLTTGQADILTRAHKASRDAADAYKAIQREILGDGGMNRGWKLDDEVKRAAGA